MRVRDAKPVDDEFLNKQYYLIFIYLLKWDGFIPSGEVVGHREYTLMLLWRVRSDLAYEI